MKRMMLLIAMPMLFTGCAVNQTLSDSEAKETLALVRSLPCPELELKMLEYGAMRSTNSNGYSKFNHLKNIAWDEQQRRCKK